MEMPESVNPEPIVTVCIFAYNHEAYIRQAVESVLMQQTSFAFDILIGEDGSSDNTPDILRQLQAQHPDRIQILFQDQSKKIYINGRPTGRYNFITTLQTARGRYIALLDGDDYWTDPLKLQKQVDFLEREPGCSMVYTPYYIKKNQEIFPMPFSLAKHATKQDVLSGFIPPTLTIVFRNSPDLTHFMLQHLEYPTGDRLLGYWSSLHGNLCSMDVLTAVYRDSGTGVWSAFSSNERNRVSLERFVTFHTHLGFPAPNTLMRKLLPRSIMYLIQSTEPFKQKFHYLRSMHLPIFQKLGFFRYTLCLINACCFLVFQQFKSKVLLRFKTT